jgi:hypothetical protein
MRSEGRVLLVWLQLVVLRVQTLQCLLSVLGKVWPADGRHCSSEEAWLPLLVGFLPFRSLSPLCLFDLGLEICGDSELLAYYSICDTVPEL